MIPRRKLFLPTAGHALAACTFYSLANAQYAQYRYVRNIKPENLGRGDSPPPGKRLHKACQKQEVLNQDTRCNLPREDNGDRAQLKS